MGRNHARFRPPGRSAGRDDCHSPPGRFAAGGARVSIDLTRPHRTDHGVARSGTLEQGRAAALSVALIEACHASAKDAIGWRGRRRASIRTVERRPVLSNTDDDLSRGEEHGSMLRVAPREAMS